jgi:2-hydroxychromene-2-carboxylate isomerase
MKKIIFSLPLFVLLVLFNSCKIASDHPTQPVAAYIDNSPIYENEVDSLASQKLYELKREALHFILDKKLMEEEARHLNISFDSLVKKEIANKVLPNDTTGYSYYASKYHVDVTTAEGKNQLLQLKKQERRAVYIQELKKKHNVSVRLHPLFFKHWALDSTIISFPLNNQKSGKVTVYIISDYECSTCQQTEPILQQLIDKYTTQINFKYVYLSSYVGLPILASCAAHKQNRFLPMHHLLFKNSSLLNDKKNYKTFAQELKLDATAFMQAMEDKTVLKQQLQSTQQLMNAGIYSTPAFVVNNKLITENNSIEFLETVIEKEIKKLAN